MDTEEIENVAKYDYCVSLGWLCGTAASLSKLGLRGFSGPFDWYFSEYKGVLSQIQNRFTDFMTRENLRPFEGADKEFEDIKYGFRLNHDIYHDLDTDYDEIYKKYSRRAQVFLENIKKPTVFFRLIRDQEEIEYINTNSEYADNLVKEFNPMNKIVYVYRKGLEGLSTMGG